MTALPFHPDEHRTDALELANEGAQLALALQSPAATDSSSALPSLQVYRLQLVCEQRWGYAPVSRPEEARQVIDQLLLGVLDGRDREVCLALALDARNQPIGAHVVSVGSLSASVVHPREVFKFAILANAASLLFAHNHPSGDPTPSRDDLELTRRLVRCGELLGIELLDSLITGHHTCLSLRERGQLS